MIGNFINRFHTYTVHVRPESKRPLENPRFVKEGFHWLAFLFSFFWALYHRLWIPALIILSLTVAIQAIGEGLGFSEEGITILQGGLQVIVGFMADEMLRNKLRREGYIVADIVSGESFPVAERRFFERVAASA